MPDPERRGYLNRTTVMELLDMGRKTVDSLRIAGEIEGRTVNRKWYFTRQSVYAFIDRRDPVNTVALIAEAT